MENQPVKTLVLDFFGYTTIHGLGRLPSARFWIQRIVWVLAFLLSMTMVGYTTYNLHQQYLSLPISTVISFEQRSQPFPDIRVSNLNVIPFSKVKGDKKLSQLLEVTASLTNVSLNDFSGNYSTFPSYENETPIIIPQGNDHASSILDTMFMLRSYDHLGDMHNITLSDFIVECRFSSIFCDKGSLGETSSPEFYGLGIGFYPQGEDRIVNLSGPYFGLEMILNINQQEYVPIFSRSAGVKTSIGNDESFNVPAGFDVDIGLSTVEYNRLPGKTERCTDSDISIAYCVQNCSYSFAACRCKCRWKSWDCHGKYKDSCQTFADFECIDMEVYYSSQNENCSSCSVPCHELKYRRTMSMSKYPANSYKPVLEKKLQRKHISTDNFDDLVFIRIYFSSLVVEIESEVYSYTVINLVSDIGGQLGLWVGISILSLLEVLELTGLLILSICQGKKIQASQKESVQTNPEKSNPLHSDILEVQDLTI